VGYSSHGEDCYTSWMVPGGELAVGVRFKMSNSVAHRSDR
jgi:hypothetical protein